MCGYAFLFFLLFGSHLERFNTVFGCVHKCIGFFIYRIDFYQLLAFKPFVGFITVASYFFTAYLLINNIFVTALNATVNVVRHDVTAQTKDYEVMQFARNRIMNQFMGLAIAKTNSDMNDMEEESKSQLALLETRIADFERTIAIHIGTGSEKKPNLLLNSRVICSD